MKDHLIITLSGAQQAWWFIKLGLLAPSGRITDLPKTREVSEAREALWRLLYHIRVDVLASKLGISPEKARDYYNTFIEVYYPDYK